MGKKNGRLDLPIIHTEKLDIKMTGVLFYCIGKDLQYNGEQSDNSRYPCVNAGNRGKAFNISP